MVLAFFNSGSGDGNFDNIVAKAVGMLGDARHSFDLATLALLTQTDSESVADDITQDVFLSALGGLSNFRHKAKFSTWLCRIALNTTYSYLRTEKRSPISYCRELSEDCSREPSPEATVLCAELDGEVRAALSELSPKLRAAIVLTSLDQLDAKEAAQIEGCTIATMYWRIHQARKKLRHRLQNWLSP